MSSSITQSLLSKAKHLAKTGVIAAAKGGMLGPIALAGTGIASVGKFFVYTTVGRILILVVMLFGTFQYFKAHFSAIESSKWKAAVIEKQTAIDKKVEVVNSETRQAQEIARTNKSWWDSIVAVVTDGILRVQPAHPIESETIDLINETRGSSAKNLSK